MEEEITSDVASEIVSEIASEGNDQVVQSREKEQETASEIISYVMF